MDDDIRVLVVDEDRDVLELTETFLERESATLTVLTEQSASDAVDRIFDEDIDCVVSDYRMPGMDGLELFEAVRDRTGDLPFFLLTAAADEETVERAESAGVTGFIEKGAGTDHYTDLANRIVDVVE
ncbi:response regulator [Salinibaculum rarum]|uniref:response regulator n=1 Tax=Salinibaculum rarum TaxID=3058903 RepID=UPI00265DA24A|nr:response regulator [Salinibaculum sp. KK48]